LVSSIGGVVTYTRFAQGFPQGFPQFLWMSKKGLMLRKERLAPAERACLERTAGA